MSSCPTCGARVEPGSGRCTGCGQPIEASLPPTERVDPAPRGSPSPLSPSATQPPLAGQRFEPGTVLGGRYRVVGPLGRGGMGEVYLAEDLGLSASVALKFLPPAFARDSDRIARLSEEVRVARQVSHPNVARVHDLGEADGHVFISMEYIDGEDLGALLKRIGRLAGERADEVARQICAGLAAAHAAGVLHRDLKPANIMLDSQGRARITDFGLAVAEGLSRDGEMAGTPAYMAPELLSGGPANERSDLYALGLVLYELYTGERAFKGDTLAELRRVRRESTPVTPTQHVREIPPRVEQVILDCLRVQPASRPSSALEVLTTLSGGDPLKAALAAGQTPSPQAVAGSHESGVLRPRTAWLAFVAILICLAPLIGLNTRLQVIGLSSPPHPPAVLASRVMDGLGRLGITGPWVDQASGWTYDRPFLEWINTTDRSSHRWEALSRRPGALRFWHRRARTHMVPFDFTGFGRVTPDDPPANMPGQVTVELDPDGNLLRLTAIPAATAAPDGEASVEWSELLALAGLDESLLKPVQPTLCPPVFADSRAAWKGTLPGQPGTSIRVEAAALDSAPVHFEVLWPWRPEGHSATSAARRVHQRSNPFLLLALVLMVGAVLLAVRNLQRGGGDITGAIKLAVFMLLSHLVTWALRADHVPRLGAEIAMFVSGVGRALFWASLVWLFYLAVEPYARRLWPHGMVSWNRLLAGRVSDPMVARDVLVGELVAVVSGTLCAVVLLTPRWLGSTPSPPLRSWTDALMGPRFFLSALTEIPGDGIFVTMAFLMLILLLRIVVRGRLLTAALFVVCATATVYGMFFSGFDQAWAPMAALVLLAVAWMVLLSRLGFLALFVAIALESLGGKSPATTDLGSWYAGFAVANIALLVVLAGYGLYFSVGRQPLLRDDLLGR